MVTSVNNAAMVSTESAEIARRAPEAEQCALLVIDVQEKLLPPIFQKEQLLQNAQLLIRAASILQIPALISTQYAKGLGATVPGIASSILLLWQRRFLFRAEATAGQAQYVIAVRDGKPHLRVTNGTRRSAGRIRGACGVGCGQLAYGVELENRIGSDARRRRGNFLDRDDDL